MDQNNETKNYPQTFNFLSEVYEVVKSFDKIDKNSSKLNNKLNELKNKFERAKQVLNNMNGIQMSYIEQQEYYNSLLKQYETKLKLLDSYKSSCSFDTSEIQTENNDLYFKLSSNENGNGKKEMNEEQKRLEASEIKSEDIDMDFMGSNL